MYAISEKLNAIKDMLIQQGKTVEHVGNNEIRVLEKHPRQEGREVPVFFKQVDGEILMLLDLPKLVIDDEKFKAEKLVKSIGKQLRKGGGDGILMNMHGFKFSYTPSECQAMDVKQTALDHTRAEMKAVLADRIMKVAKDQKRMKGISPAMMRRVLEGLSPVYDDNKVGIRTFSAEDATARHDTHVFTVIGGFPNDDDEGGGRFNQIMEDAMNAIKRDSPGTKWLLRDYSGSEPIVLSEL